MRLVTCSTDRTATGDVPRALILVSPLISETAMAGTSSLCNVATCAEVNAANCLGESASSWEKVNALTWAVVRAAMLEVDNEPIGPSEIKSGSPIAIASAGSIAETCALRSVEIWSRVRASNCRVVKSWTCLVESPSISSRDKAATAAVVNDPTKANDLMSDCPIATTPSVKIAAT